LQVEAIFTLEMLLSKPIGNQTPATSALAILVTAATRPLSHDATNVIATTKAPFSQTHYSVTWIHLCIQKKPSSKVL